MVGSRRLDAPRGHRLNERIAGTNGSRVFHVESMSAVCSARAGSARAVQSATRITVDGATVSLTSWVPSKTLHPNRIGVSPNG